MEGALVERELRGKGNQQVTPGSQRRRGVDGVLVERELRGRGKQQEAAGTTERGKKTSRITAGSRTTNRNNYPS